MHKVDIGQATIDAIMERRGRLHFERIEPAKTALLVVDMQNSFVKEGAGHTWVPEAASIVPNINALATNLRAAGGVIVWIVTTYTEETRANWSHFHDELWTPERSAKRAEALSAGHPAHDLYDALELGANDLTVHKTHYSAFIQGSSDLQDQLLQRGIENVIVTGTATNVCCESTARDAMMLNFRTIMVSDANAAFSEEAHNTTLRTFWGLFGDVQSTAELAQVLRPAQASEAAE